MGDMQHCYHLTALVHHDRVTAHKIFLERTWWQVPWWARVPGIIELKAIRYQSDEDGTDAIRELPGGTQEQITNAELGEFIEYEMVRKQPFPEIYHRGLIQFYSVGLGLTVVTWEVLYKSTSISSLAMWLRFWVHSAILKDYERFANVSEDQAEPIFLRNVLHVLLLLYFVARVFTTHPMKSKLKRLRSLIAFGVGNDALST